MTPTEPVAAPWFDRLITLRSAAHRHGACDPLGPDYDAARRAADDAFDTAVADVRAAVDEASGGAFSDYQGGDTVRAAVARLCALATGAKAGEGAGG